MGQVYLFNQAEIQSLKQALEIKNLRTKLSEACKREATEKKKLVDQLEEQAALELKLGDQAYVDSLVTALKRQGVSIPAKGRIFYDLQNIPIGFEPEILDAAPTSQSVGDGQVL